MKTKLCLFLILVSSFAALGQKGAETKAVRAFINAFNERKVDAMMNLAADDLRWFNVVGDRMSLQWEGKPAFRAFMEEFMKSCPTCRSKITSISQNGTRVSLTETASWTEADGIKTKKSFSVYEFADGRIARAYYYGDPASNAYDEPLAKRLGADERGMKTYVFVNLVRGKKQFAPDERNKLIAGHLENIGKLAATGKLVLAGPFEDDSDVRGIYIFDVDTIEKAKALTESDPAVKAGVFEFEMRLWYGSAALKELNRIHNTIQKKAITEK